MAIKVRHIQPKFKDKRGFIAKVLDDKKVTIKSILYIDRKKGSIGADHYHIKDNHYILIIKGKMKYSERDMKKSNSKIISVTLNSGDMVLSNPMVAHRTEFLEDTQFFAFATEHRTQKEYEKDTVRINFDDLNITA